MSGTGIKKKPQLPKQQLLILAICRFAEPVAMTSVYPYIPEMIQSFDIPTDQVAKWAGLMAATFSLSQCLTAIPWGRASDRFGRKPLILLTLSCTMFSGLLFGFSPSLTWAFIARSIQGFSCGNVGIVRTTVAEMVPEKELQPLAFSIMPLVWNIGSIFGPAFGGSLVHPAQRFSIFQNSKLFQDYPFALPNITASFLFLIGISSGILFLRESLEEQKSRRDYGLMLGSLLTRSCRKREPKVRHSNRDSLEAAPFLLDAESNEMENQSPRKSPNPTATTPAPTPRKKARWADVFTPQSNINLAAYTFLAMHSVAYDQLLPIYLHHPTQSRSDRNFQPPLKFAGGFGMNSDSIGWIFMVYGVVGMLIQFLLFPPVARSATSLKLLGTLNGVATSISAAGRAAGPALTGATFTVGVDIGYIILPWWTLTAVGIVGAIPVWYLIEMEGFSAMSQDRNADGERSSDEEREGAIPYDRDGIQDAVFDEDPMEPINPLILAQAESNSQPQTRTATSTDHSSSSPTRTQTQTQTTRHRKSSTFGTRPQRRSSISDGVTDDEDVIHEEADTESDNESPRRRNRPKMPNRADSSFNRRPSLDLPDLYRVTSPIGFGPQGVARGRQRRFSSDLGATRSGLGTGGTAWH